MLFVCAIASDFETPARVVLILIFNARNVGLGAKVGFPRHLSFTDDTENSRLAQSEDLVIRDDFPA